MKKSLTLKGKFKLVIRDTEGNILATTGWIANTITNAGFAAVAGLMGNTGAITAFTYLALGTDNTAASAAQTALGAEVVDTGLVRSVATISRSTTTQTNDTLQFDFTWTATGAKTLQEIGVFNASSSGIMLARQVISPSITTANTNLLTVTYKVQVK